MPPPAVVPDTEPGLFLKGMEALEAGDFSGAEQVFRSLLAFAPKHAAAQHFGGAALYQQGNLDEAASMMRQSLQLHRGHRSWLENLIKVEQARGDDDQVAKLQALLDDFGNQDPLPNLGAEDAVTVMSGSLGAG